MEPTQSDLGRVRAIDEPDPQPPVRGAVIRHTPRGRAISARPARLLVVRLERRRQAQVRDEPDVGFVDPHPKSICRDDDPCRAVHEAALHRRADGPRKACVV